MKSLVLTAQDARDLQSLGALTITKPIKGAPAYMEGGRIVCSATTPGSFCYEREGASEEELRAEFTPPVQAGDAAYIREPWHYRHEFPGENPTKVTFAADLPDGEAGHKWASPVSMPEAAAVRYVRVVSVAALHHEAASAWEIAVELIDKAQAAAIDAGLPYSSAEPGEGSDAYTYAGDMSPEDHQHMTAAINADRDRLEAITARLSEITLELTTATDEGEKALLEERDTLAKEAAEITRALVDAGVLSEDALPGVLPKAPETTDAPEGEEPAQEPGGEDAPADPEEDEEVGSFTLGKCRFCGREWGVTLEGSKTGGYPTQRTADAAATRACTCEEAAANRSELLGVAVAVTTGACRYCGQLQEVGPHPTQAAADETASEVCSCAAAKRERRVREQTEDAQEKITRIFGEEAESLGFRAAPEESVALLNLTVGLIARGFVSSANLNLLGLCKAKLSITSKGKIKVSRSETRSFDLESGE